MFLLDYAPAFQIAFYVHKIVDNVHHGCLLFCLRPLLSIRIYRTRKSNHNPWLEKNSKRLLHIFAFIYLLKYVEKSVN